MHNNLDNNVIQNCILGDRKAQLTFYNAYIQYLYTISFRIIKNKELAEDITHECFILIFQKLAELKSEKALITWMKRIVINKSIDYWKKETKFRFVEIADKHLNEESDEDLPQDIPWEVVLDKINQLPEKHRIIIELFYLQEMSHEEVSENLGVTYSNSRVLLMRAKEKLKTLLK